jgi:alpha-tubulin suppressor-like RCC1 family protein
MRSRGFGVAVLAVFALASALSAASASAAAPSGGLLAFGSNLFGQLGVTTNSATTNANPTPTLVGLPGGMGTVTQIAAGSYHGLAVTSSGQLYAFGNNYYGELGSTTNNGTSTANPTPTLVALPGEIGTVTQTAAGGNDSLALTSSGQLYAFGYNADGELGNTTNTGTNNPTPTPTLVTFPGEIGTVTQIAAGSFHSLALTSSGQLYAFGYNAQGQLGITTNSGTANANPTPMLVALPGQIGTVTEIAAGAYYSLAVTSSGQLYAFGDNLYGELGSATNSGTGTPNPTPTLVGLPGQIGTVSQISAGGDHSLAVTSSGQLYTFGSNAYGQLGSTTNSGVATANPTPTLVGLPGQIGTVTQIAAAETHSLAVTSSGQLYTFGDNYYGQLGNATNSGMATANPTPAPAGLAPGTTIDTVATGPVATASLAIVSGLTITSGSLPGARAGSPYSAALSAAGGTAPLSWSASGLPGGLSIDAHSGVISGTPTAAGSSAVAIAVSDAYGSQTSRSLTLAVAPAPAPAGHTPPPVVSATQTHRTWRERRSRKHKHGAPIGTTFSITLNERAKVTLAFTHTIGGRKVARHCTAQTKKNRHKPKCSRTVTAGTLTFTAHPGVNKIPFKGRFSASKKLPPGRYTLVIIATASGKSSAPRNLTFTIQAS